MNLVQELEPLNSHLDNWKKGHGLSNRGALEDLADIWNRFALFNREKIYNSSSIIPPKVDLNCSSCIFDMLTMLYNWREILKPNMPAVEYKAIKPKITKIDLSEESSLGIANNPELSDEDKIAHLQQRCKDRGIKYHHKAGVKKLTELLAE